MFRCTSVSDIAGQMTAASANADRVTVATVSLPSGGLKKIRRSLSPGFPKWRNANDAEVRFVVEQIRREALSIAVASIDKTSNDWRQFWEDANDTHNKVSSIEGGKVGFLKAATMLKFLMFGHSCAMALGHAILVKSIPNDLQGGRKLTVAEAVIFDDEIQGNDNRDALVEIWRSINGHQPLSNSIGLTRTASTLQLSTEESELLLLLADYAAGLCHARSSTAKVLAKSKVTAGAAGNAYLQLSKSRKFMDFSGIIKLNYYEIYPEFQKFSRANAP